MDDVNGNEDITRVEQYEIKETQRQEANDTKLDMNILLSNLEEIKNANKYDNDAEAKRLYALAKTYLELGTMIAVKAITSKLK